MARKPEKIELSLSPTARACAQQARVLNRFNRLLMAYRPAAAVINRVTRCVGTELMAPYTQVGANDPCLLVTTWQAETAAMDKAERLHGLNHPDYLYEMMGCLLAPLDIALRLHVTDRNGTLWVPETAPIWTDWRAAHPGPLRVCVQAPKNRADRRLALEQWALGELFMQKIKATSQWPEPVTVS